MLDIAPIEQKIRTGCPVHYGWDGENESRETCYCFDDFAEQDGPALIAEIKRLRAMLPEQYAAGFRDGVAAVKPLDASAPFVVGPDAG
jgi:hypothetical protein